MAFDALLLEFAVCAISAAIATFGSLTRGLIFIACARACGPFNGMLARPGHPISVNALAASLGRPFETTRRHTNSLLETGLLTRSDGGLSVSPDVIANLQSGAFTRLCHDLMVRLIEDIHLSSMPLPASRATLAYDPVAGTGIALDFVLAGFETHTGREPNLTRLALLAAVQWANWRFGSDAGEGYGAAPVKPATVARIVGLPYATVSRNIDQLVLDGALVRTPDGLLVSQQYIAAPVLIESRAALANRARQLIGRLAQSGFPMERPPEAYVAGRPGLPALG